MKVTWLGDEDASIREITQGGHVFPHGVAVTVPDNDPSLSVFDGNPFFTVEEGEAKRGPGRPPKEEG